MKLVPNPGRVLGLATSMWAVYGALLITLIDKAPEWLKGEQAAHLFSEQQRFWLLTACLVLAPIFRVIQQNALREPAIKPLEKQPLRGDPL